MILQYSTVVKIRGLLIVCVIFEKCFTTFSCFKFVVKRVRVGFRVSLDVSFTFYFTLLYFISTKNLWSIFLIWWEFWNITYTLPFAVQHSELFSVGFELLYYSRSSHPLGTLLTFFSKPVSNSSNLVKKCTIVY